MPPCEFHPLVWKWFTDRFGAPTEPQLHGWPAIAAGQHTLIAAPTGSGKTLAAFMVCIDRLARGWCDGQLTDETRVVYVSPLKALSNDIQRNLEQPLAEIRERFVQSGMEAPPIRALVRTGDTPQQERQAMLRRAPHILVTTPESLYLLITSERGRHMLRTVDTVIVDEIHAVARDKRGSHLSLSLARLDHLCGKPPTRIGLSATQKPIDEVARFLIGADHVDEGGQPRCQIIDSGHIRQLDLAIEVPPSELSAVCSHEQWGEVYDRLTELIKSHRSTLVFVNTRRLAERVAHHLAETLGDEAIASHHGSLSRELRLSAEQRLKSGKLKAIVATASLEMGIDVGYIDLVCQIGSPRSIATFLQRVGRSGHSLGLTPCGRLFPLTRDELIECLALIRAVREGILDQLEIPRAPLDILAQQIVAEVACGPWDEEELYRLCRRAWPYRDLTTQDFADIVRLLSEGITPGSRRGRYLHRDAIHKQLRPTRAARLTAITSGGAIPETGQYRVLAEPDQTFVGQLDEDFAIESTAGDIFLLGNTSWQIIAVRSGEVIVRDANGAPPSIPFWFGEAPGRTFELSEQVSRLRTDIASRLTGQSPSHLLAPLVTTNGPSNENTPANDADICTNTSIQVHKDESEAGTPLVIDTRAAERWVREECGADTSAALQAAMYIGAQQVALGIVPTRSEIVLERFFDESGGMQLVIHAPLGARVNRAWGLALRKRFCRSFDFELQAAADDDGIILSLGPQHSFPLETICHMINSTNAEYLLEQALLAVPMFRVRWRWNVTRALTVLRQRAGRKVPPYLQRFQADDLLAVVFPETVGCLENHHGDVKIPDHPLVRQTMHDCLHEAMDIDRWRELLLQADHGRVRLLTRDTREPSPFCHELLNANPYAFLDGAPLEERRTRAVTTRRGLSLDAASELGRLEPAAIDQVTQEAWPLVRDAEELHDALWNLIALPHSEAGPWQAWFGPLVNAGRAVRVMSSAGEPMWIASERWPIARAIWTDGVAEPTVQLPASLDETWETSNAVVELIRGRILHCGPVTASSLAARFGLRAGQVTAALEALEGQGVVMRGHYDLRATPDALQSSDIRADREIQWCDRRLLARIHRLTLQGLRQQIQPVDAQAYLRFLLRHQRLITEQSVQGPAAIRDVIEMLQGQELPALVWESHVLASRTKDYQSAWLDQLFQTGEVTWGRLRTPEFGSKNGRRGGAAHRAMPISIMLRACIAWLLPAERENKAEGLGCHAQQVWDALVQHGALFPQEIVAATNLLPSYLEEGLRELASAGLIHSDGFDAVRSLAAKGGRVVYFNNHSRSATSSGRWARFPGLVQRPESEPYLRAWCHQLVRRWGVVFRELMAREPTAPSWHRLIPVFRNLERRGELRGGRFVAGVGGEQYGSTEAIEALRKVREPDATEPWIAVSAADPVNLVGILPSALDRIRTAHTGALVLWQGRCIASYQKKTMTFHESVSPEMTEEMRRALYLARRPSATPLLVRRGPTPTTR